MSKLITIQAKEGSIILSPRQVLDVKKCIKKWENYILKKKKARDRFLGYTAVEEIQLEVAEIALLDLKRLIPLDK